MSQGLLTLVAAAAVLFLARELWERRKARERQLFFADREVLDFGGWYETFYGQSGLDRDLIAKLLGFLAEVVGVAPTQFRPSDKIHGNLSYSSRFLVLDDPLEEFFELVNDYLYERGIPPLDSRNGSCITLDDFIRNVSEHLKRSRSEESIMAERKNAEHLRVPRS